MYTSYRKDSLTPLLSQHHAADRMHHRAALLRPPHAAICHSHDRLVMELPLLPPLAEPQEH